VKFYIALACLLVSISSNAYVPTVESLFRHGNNPDVTTNAIMVSAKVTLANQFLDKVEGAPTESALWVRWIYNVTGTGKLKLTQLIYRSQAMVEASLVDKVYVAELSPQSFGTTPEASERGLFMGLMNSLLINDGSFMVEFLRQRGIPVQLNSEILNRDKRALLARYRTWLLKTKGGRVAGGEESPLAPTQGKEEVEALMSASMYLDTKQVTLARYEGEPAWQVKADIFDAWVSDASREVRQVALRTPTQESEFQCRDYILFNGTHSFPRQILVKGQHEQVWQIDIVGIKTFSESSADLLSRLRRYDQALMQRRETVVRPAFMF
jgi:hypothetical protein